MELDPLSSPFEIKSSRCCDWVRVQSKHNQPVIMIIARLPSILALVSLLLQSAMLTHTPLQLAIQSTFPTETTAFTHIHYSAYIKFY